LKITVIGMTKISETKWVIRQATEEDVPIILDTCYQLSRYEKLKFKGTEALYRKYGFGKDKIFDCLLAENTGDTGPDFLGIALYYYTFSTFEGKPTLWLEDMFVRKEYRRKGIGTALMKRLCQIALEKDCSRIDWIVLNWNEPTRQFSFNLGATAEDEWTIFRMTPDVFRRLAES
jgi:GNAT superfamily N-acetyltransferase